MWCIPNGVFNFNEHSYPCYCFIDLWPTANFTITHFAHVLFDFETSGLAHPYFYWDKDGNKRALCFYRRIWLCWFIHMTMALLGHMKLWFQTFAVFWMLYAFFWVIPRRLNFICRHFGTLCLFHLHRQVGMKND